MPIITYQTDVRPSVESILEVYRSSGINRPIDDVERIEKMYANSNLIVTAWQGAELVGVARSLTDFCYCCYLSDLAVKLDYQKTGIGKKLVELTKETIGPQAMLLLLSAPTAMEYYPKLGMESVRNGFIVKREQ